MNAYEATHTFDEPVPFFGHPFGGLIRDERDAPIAVEADKRDAVELAAADDGGGFDFHLGVYSRF